MNVLHRLLQRVARLMRPGALRRARRAVWRTTQTQGTADVPARPTEAHTASRGFAPPEAPGTLPPRETLRPVIEIRPLTEPPAPAHPSSATTAPVAEPAAPPLYREPHAPAAARAEFRAGSFFNRAGRRAFRLFVPDGAPSAKRPLLVMLHGCKQDAQVFAEGTRMNELARAA